MLVRRFGLQVLFALATLLAPGADALAQPQVIAELPPKAVVISPGERLVLSAVSADPSVQSRGPVPAGDLAAVPKLDNTFEVVRPIAVKGSLASVPGSLVLELTSTAKDGARLVGLNGADVPLVYTAVLVFQRGERRQYVTTSTCPVQPGRAGVESWPSDVAGIAIVGVQRLRPGDTACNNGSLLSVAAAAPSQHYACSGQQPGDGPLPLFEVTLVVDANGAVSQQMAAWTLSRADIFHAPAVAFDYAMEGDHIVSGARSARVMAAIDLHSTSDAKTADIVLHLDGVEVARRPWRMFAQRMATRPTVPGSEAMGFVGVVPFIPADDSAAEPALRRMLATIGSHRATLDVQVVGDTGAVLVEGTYDIDPSTPVNDPPRVSAALQQAQAAARTPTQCRAIKPAAG